MIDELNTEAFELIKLVSLKPKEKRSQREEQKGSVKEKGFMDMSDKLVGGAIERATDLSDKTISIFYVDDNGSFGFDETNYPKYKSLVDKISLFDEFKNKIAESFIESKSFNWVLDVYRNQKAGVTLIDHLRVETENNISTFQFHFPVFNLEIEEPFKIGNAEFIFFTKEYWDNYYKSLQEKKPTDEKDFDEIFRKDFQGQVLAKVTVMAERDKAEEIAKNEAENAVNVLKLYGITPAIPERKTMFDLNFRLNYQVKTLFLSQNLNEKDGLALNLKFQNPPLNFCKEHFLSANQSGLRAFSNYLTLKKDNELYNLVIQAIGFIGSALSNWDLHLRCVNLITTLESLLLKDDETGDLEQKAKARLSKIIANDFKEKEKIKSIFSNIYQVRHKMIHKAKRLPINAKELAQAQIIMINLLLKLMRFNIVKNHIDKTTVIEELNQIKS